MLSHFEKESMGSIQFNGKISPSKKNLFICFNESPLKMMKNAFYFILKALSAPNLFKLLSLHFGHVEETA